MMKAFQLLCVFLLSLSGAAQQPTGQQEVANRYEYSKTTSLSGTSEAVTLQASADSSKIQVQYVAVYCSVDCIIEIERNGTAATGTAGTALETNPEGPAATASVFYSSDVGDTTGTQWPIPAESWLYLDKSDTFLLRANTGENLTVRSNPITGSITINIKWEEYDE